ncbi:hypothetical protein GOP47_0014392 [Adiantum capillus-veneris]|uniref:Xyloglucan endotransglucosylase/hydrolase n=1 Tax=Adiantum capillus-veneris TaxID=13818 RepID=A0A9D4ULY9_ADICA|nr:hypothetical protein GOP47_0014392 [Adiantum capillus-veneris]
MSLGHYALLSTFILICSVSQLPAGARSSDLTSVFYTMSTPDHVQFVDDGQEIHLSLDQKNASGFESYDGFLFGHFNMRIKLVPGDSAGTVTTYYFSSLGDRHDELDFEFLGNSSGEPVNLQTNVFSNGVGGREQRIFLWFDPTTDFHNYTLLWNRRQVVFYVDGVPIRVFPNIEQEQGVPYLHNQSMKAYATIWDGDSWATQGGRVKIDWTHAPFVASYRDFTADACTQTTTMAATECASSKWWDQMAYQGLDGAQLDKLKWVQSNLTVYDYCTDVGRYNVTPPECVYAVPLSTAEVSPSPSPSSTSLTPTMPSSPSSSIASPNTSSLGPSGSPSSMASPSGQMLVSSTLSVVFLSLIFIAIL